ncbi:hypothetical protein KKA93_00595 [Patescibacteria group bacterium]|nr:hypothetical protein [Patescibacteria group bacterium]MBU1663146.1 hypothetical protein [Patescibacteria group bacterium]MBU1934078.1 hypothetical protein [Patescibacteria group bacterium]MBU2008095.1 hypothetical protein [Patescibacteria group bacterium]MBU2233410.1 hypothetical protein [Patescibacteria group bacterium]
MKINFTKKQFLSLMKLAYLGNWLANASRLQDEQIKEYEEAEDYIFSFAKEFGYDRYVDHEPKDGDRYFPTRYFEEETDVEILQEDYDNETFWQEASDRFGERDFFEKYGEEAIEKMDRKERFIKRMECEEKYEKEFEEKGIERLEIKE